MSDNRAVVSVHTPHTKAVYEAGKKLLIDSVDVGREFCRFMITTSLGAIPIYLALLEFLGTKDSLPTIGLGSRLLLWSPTLFFTLAAVSYMIGYFPNAGMISLDIVEEILEQRSQILVRQSRAIMLATIVLIIGILGAVGTFFVLP